MTAKTSPMLFSEAEAAEQSGDPAAALSLYEACVVAPNPESAVSAAEALRRVARCHHRMGEFRAARDVLHAALAMAGVADDVHTGALILNTQAAVAQTLGELDEAERLYEAARSRASAAGLDAVVAMVDQNLGTLANTRGQFPEALLRYNQALQAYEACGQPERRGPLLANIGRLHTDLGKWGDAAEALKEASRCARLQQDAAGELLVQVNISRMELAKQDLDAARMSVQLSEKMAAQLGDTRWTGLIAKQRGVLERELGAAEAAVSTLRDARTSAETTGDRLLEAEVARELARSHWAAKQNKETLRWLNRAHRLFEELQARHDIADTRDRVSELEDLFFQIVREWSASIESKDAYTRGHSDRVAHYALKLAEAAGLEAEDRTWFEMGGLLHDVGKVIVPDTVLNKPGRLDADEWAVMKSHAAEGERLLSDVEFPWDVAPMVRHHHEAWDGSGYPDGLKGEEIPWNARVLCVADVFDALTSARPYRGANTVAEAIEIMDGMNGKTFDPTLYRVFRAMVVRGEVGPGTEDE